MTLSLVRPVPPLSERPSWWLRVFCASVRNARKYPALADAYLAGAYYALRNRILLEERKR